MPEKGVSGPSYFSFNKVGGSRKDVANAEEGAGPYTHGAGAAAGDDVVRAGIRRLFVGGHGSGSASVVQVVARCFDFAGDKPGIWRGW